MEEMDLELADLSQGTERISQDIDMPSTPSYYTKAVRETNSKARMQ